MRSWLSRPASVVGLAVPVVSLLLPGLARTQSSDVTVTTPSHATAPGVFALVDLRNIPTAPWPAETLPRGAHIHGELVQHEVGAHRTLGGKEPAFPAEPPPQLTSPPTGPGSSVVQWTAGNDGSSSPGNAPHSAGSSQVIEAVDSGFAVYSRFGGEVRGYTSFQSFLNLPPGWQGFTFAPRIVRDFYGSTTMMLVLGRDDANARSYFWLATPALPPYTGEYTGQWWIWRFDATETTGDSPAWLDDAGLALDDQGVYVTGDYFYFTGGFRGSNLWSVNAPMRSGGATNGWQYVDLRWPGGDQAVALQPALQTTFDFYNRTFFVNTYTGSGSDVVLWKMSGDRANAPTLTQAVIGVAPYQALGMHVDQPGSDVDLDAGDARIRSAVFRQTPAAQPGAAVHEVDFVLTDDVDGDGTSSGWLTVNLDVNANTNIWQDLLWSGPGYYYFSPAIAVQDQIYGHALAVFGSWASPESDGNQFVSGLFKIYTNPLDASGPLISHAAGLGPYVALDDEGRNRWAEQSSATFDGGCDYAWGAVQTADVGNRRRTVINAATFGFDRVCPEINVLTPIDGEVWNGGTTHTITWQSRGLTPTNSIAIHLNQSGTQVQLQPYSIPIDSTSFDWSVSGMPGGASISVGSWPGTVGGTFEALGFSGTFTIIAPDLRVTNFSASQTAPAPGASFTVGATVANQGNGSTNVPATLRFYVSTDSTITTADTELGSTAVGVLDGGGSAGATLSVTAPTTPGYYWIGACADAVPGESSTVNRCTPGFQISVGLLVNLVANEIFAPLDVAPGQTFTVATTVSNQGIASASFRVGVYLSTDAACDTADLLIGSRLVTDLGPGLASTASNPATVPINAAQGSGYICAVADDLHQVPETQESDNIVNRIIGVFPPTVGLLVNEKDSPYPVPVLSSGPVRLTVSMTAGGVPLDHYLGMYVGGTLFWVTASGLSTTPAPFARFTPVNVSNAVVLDVPHWPSGASVFLWLMVDGSTVVSRDQIAVYVTP